MNTIEKLVDGLYEKQIEFCQSEAQVTFYGGAAGGGKSHVLFVKLILLALNYAGIQILLLRNKLPEVLTYYKPKMLQVLLPLSLAKFVGNPNNEMRFKNGSIIYFGYCSTDDDINKYQGNQFDVIAIDEAGNFTFKWFTLLRSRNRASGLIQYKEGQNIIKPRMYLTANPIGVGMRWLKRLFVTRKYTDDELLPYRKKVYKLKRANGEYNFEIPEKYSGTFAEFLTKKEFKEMNELANALITKDYYFIPASVYDNKNILENDPEYITKLEQLPDKQREALLYGGWDTPEGAFFYDFNPSVHVINPFKIPKEWRIFRARDYGLDKLACLWIAMDFNGFCYVYKAVGEERKIVSESAKIINDNTNNNENIYLDLCPPDMWNKNPQTGKSAVEVLREYEQLPTKANNDRINGWLAVHEFLKLIPDEQGNLVPRLRIFNTPDLQELIECMQMIQFDEKNPNDAAKTPHDVTHFPDALRYFCSSYTYKPDIEYEDNPEEFDFGKFALGYYKKDEEIGGVLDD